MAGQHPLQRLQDLINLERQDIVTLLSYGLGIGLLSLTTPIAVQALVNTIAFGALMQPLIVLTLILLVLFLIPSKVNSVPLLPIILSRRTV